MNKKQLYENIMKSVAKEVKKTLNENNAGNMRAGFNKFLEPCRVQITDDILTEVIKEAAGYVIQHKVFEMLLNSNICKSVSINKRRTYDIYAEFDTDLLIHHICSDSAFTVKDLEELANGVKIEVKGFKRDVTDVVLTAKLFSELQNPASNVFYLLANYAIDGNSIIINKYYLLSAAEMKNCVTASGRSAYGNKNLRNFEIK